jgi:hypothetical protein
MNPHKAKILYFLILLKGLFLGAIIFLSPFFRHSKNRAPGRSYLFFGDFSGGDVAGLASYLPCLNGYG